MRLIVFLTVIATVAGAKAAPITPPQIQPAIPARATIEFYDSDFITGLILEATIDVISVLPGEQGNGLAITFVEGAFFGISRTGNPATSVTITLDNTSSTSYDEIVEAVDWIPEVTATLRMPTAGASYYAPAQTPPATVILSGGTDAVVPEPASLGLTLLGIFFTGLYRRSLRSDRAC